MYNLVRKERRLLLLKIEKIKLPDAFVLLTVSLMCLGMLRFLSMRIPRYFESDQLIEEFWILSFGV